MRLQELLLLGLLTLVLPWGGCRYARQMEAALREGEANSLQAVAQTIAASNTSAAKQIRRCAAAVTSRLSSHRKKPAPIASAVVVAQAAASYAPEG